MSVEESPGFSRGRGFKIDNIIIRSIVTNSITIEWDSTSGGTSQIEYSEVGYNNITQEELFSYFHITKIDGLLPGTTYNLRIKSIDRFNNVTYSNNIQVNYLTLKL